MVSSEVAQKEVTVSREISVLIVDEQAVLRDGLRALLAHHSDIKIIGEASEADQAAEIAHELKPDIIVLDVALPGMGGIEAIKRIIKDNPKAKVLVLTQYCDREHVTLSIKAGALGYVPKQASGSEVVNGIRVLHSGDSFLHPCAASALVQDYVKYNLGEPYDLLTSRERQILRMIAEGQTSNKIADSLSIALKTVLSHRNNIMKKLALNNRTALIKYAMKKGLVEL